MFVILYMAFGVVIEELCPSPLFFFYVWYHLVCIWMMMKTLAFCWGLHHVFFKSEFNGFVINKVFEYLNNAVGFFLVLYTMKYYFVVFMRSSLLIGLWSMCEGI